jgi:very-short-patch-repair endonuclease
MAPDVLRAIAERASQQLGLVTVDQLRDLHISSGTQRTLVRRGSLEPVGVRVRRLPGHPPTWHQRLLAATLEAGPGAVVSHGAALALWRFVGAAPGVVEVTLPRGRRPRRVPGRVHHARDLLPVDVGWAGGLPVTTPSRSLIDAAPQLPPGQLERMLDHAARDGLVYVPYLRWRLDDLRRRGRPGVRPLLAVLPAEHPRRVEESWLERQVVDLLRDARLPPPRCQARLRVAGGVARVDLCYDDVRLVVEVDGHAPHSTRRQRQADAERAARLVAAGWRVVRFTYDDVVERPAHVVTTVAGLLGLDHAAL